MALSFVGSSVGNAPAAMPVGWAAGDLLVAAVSVSSSGAYSATPVGWTLVRLDNYSAGGYSHLFWIRIAQTGDTPPGMGGFYSLTAWRGIDTLVALWTITGWAEQPGGTVVSAPSLTAPAAAGIWYACFFSHQLTNTATWSTPPGLAARLSSTGKGVFDEALASGAASGDQPSTASNSGPLGSVSALLLPSGVAAGLGISKPIQVVGVAYAINPGLPAGVQAGDLMLASVQKASGAYTPPTGWTEVGSQAYSSANTEHILWKVAGAAEPSPGFGSYAAMCVVRGQDPVSPVGAVSVSRRPFTFSSVTPDRANSVLVYLFNSMSSQVYGPAQAGAGTTIRFNSNGGAVFDEWVPVAQATGTRSAFSGGLTDDVGSLIVVRAPAGAGGGGSTRRRVRGHGLAMSTSLG